MHEYVKINSRAFFVDCPTYLNISNMMSGGGWGVVSGKALHSIEDRTIPSTPTNVPVEHIFHFSLSRSGVALKQAIERNKLLISYDIEVVSR